MLHTGDVPVDRLPRPFVLWIFNVVLSWIDPATGPLGREVPRASRPRLAPGFAIVAMIVWLGGN